MPVDPRKRQKKLERLKAKQKVQRREVARRESRGMSSRLAEASLAPILHACATADLWDHGIGHVLVSRQLNDGSVAFADFLVDIYCLGVKDVFLNIAPRAIYERDLYDKLRRQYQLILLKPECARKLVEGAVAYALDLGLPPHADYRIAKEIFGNISAEACSEEYEFGKDGKPFFFAGPYDGPAKCQHIMRTLTKRCGPGGFHYTIPFEPPPP